MQYMSIPTNYQTAEYSDNLVKCRIRVMHDKENYNGSSFSLDSINKAKESLKNIPILAYIKENEYGEKDFDEHNIDISIDFNGDEITINEKYLEVPIGVIPSENNYSLETIDNKTYVSVDGYIWKNYSNEAFYILEEAQEKEVSMEIKVNEGKFSDNYYHIENYTYLGITVLGSDVKGAMGEHCKITMNFSTENNKEFFKAVEDLNRELKSQLEGEVQTVENTEKIATEIVEDTPVVEEVCETVVEPQEVEEDFAKKKKKSSDDSNGDCRAIVGEDNVDSETTELEVEEPEVKDIEVEEIVEEEIVIQEPTQEETVEESTIEDVVEDATDTFSITKGEYEELILELNSLREFKADIIQKERVKEIDSIVSEFAFEEEEVKELRTRAINEELTLEQFKKELFALEGMKAFANRKQFSVKTEVEQQKIVVTDVKDLGNEPYGDLFAKYNKK